jgi:pimeloyl-ACP methyl ester carboxylesterase
MCEDVVRLLDHLGIQKAHIVGYSLGGMIVEHLLTTNPERLLTATVGGFGLLRPSPELERRNERVAAEMEQGSVRSMVLHSTPPGEPVPTEEEIRKYAEVILAGQDRFALAAVRRSLPDLRVTNEKMSAVQVPTLAIVGDADPYLEPVWELKKAMPTLKVVVIENASHGGEHGAMRRPEFVEAVRDFIASHTAT